jgi:hypothetical protein
MDEPCDTTASEAALNGFAEGISDERARRLLDEIWDRGLNMAGVGAMLRAESGEAWPLPWDAYAAATTLRKAVSRLKRGLADPPEEPIPEDPMDEDYWKQANARTRALFAPIEAAAKAMPKKTCKACIRFMRTPGVGANTLAEVLRGHVGVDWPASYNPGVGNIFYVEALERLDRYDPDFRPRPERIGMLRSVANDGTGMVLEVHYSNPKIEF